MTQFHLGFALFFGLLFFSYLDFPTFIVANVILDIEPFAMLVTGSGYPLHGFFHSFAGTSIVALALAAGMMTVSPALQGIMRELGLGQEVAWKKVLLASFSGVYLHILLDAPLYADIAPFFPSAANPMLGLWNAGAAQALCALLFVLGIGLYALRLANKR
jgi:membrane-bound metal-dependent hydrolase YbcI (DUF457 family)